MLLINLNTSTNYYTYKYFILGPLIPFWGNFVILFSDNNKCVVSFGIITLKSDKFLLRHTSISKKIHRQYFSGQLIKLHSLRSFSFVLFAILLAFALSNCIVNNFDVPAVLPHENKSSSLPSLQSR